MNRCLPESSDVARDKPIESLHLKRRTTGVLKRLGIRTIDQLLDWSAESECIPRGAGPRTLRDLNDALTSFSLNLNRDGTIDWVGYAKTRRFVILPKKKRRHWTARALLEELPVLAKEAVAIRFGASGATIFRDYFLTPMNKPTTLANVGREMGVTRERARKIAADIIEMFRGILWQDNYRDCKFRVRPEFLQPLRAVLWTLKPYENGILSRPEWKSVLAKTWKVKPHELKSTERMILDILGLKEVTFCNEKQTSLMSPRAGNTKILRAIRREIEYLLTVIYPDGLRPQQLLALLRQKFSDTALSISDVPALIRSIPKLENKKFRGRYRAQANGLKNAADHYERLLREAGKPLNIRDIARRAQRVARGQPVLTRSVQNTLVKDPRFVVVWQSRRWALSEWRDIETRTITDLAADLLIEVGGPIDQDRLYTLIKARRAVAKNSIRALLRRDSRFNRISSRLWALGHESASNTFPCTTTTAL